jgi:hypothetical protein
MAACDQSPRSLTPAAPARTQHAELLCLAVAGVRAFLTSFEARVLGDGGPVMQLKFNGTEVTVDVWSLVALLVLGPPAACGFLTGLPEALKAWRAPQVQPQGSAAARRAEKLGRRGMPNVTLRARPAGARLRCACWERTWATLRCRCADLGLRPSPRAAADHGAGDSVLATVRTQSCTSGES